VFTRRKDNIYAAKLEEYRELLLIMSIAIVNGDIAKRFKHNFWKTFNYFSLIYFQILLTRLQEVERLTQSFKMESTLSHLQWFVLVLECSSQTRMWRSSWSQQSRILWKPNGRRRRSRLASNKFNIFKNVLCIFGLPFSVAPFPLAYMCPWLVILPLWSAACGWE
jgi:hypothetical protein